MYLFYTFMFLNFLYLFVLYMMMYTMILMSLEFMMLSLLMFLNFLILIYGDTFILMYFLIFVVCESVLGLSMLIIFIRGKGNDNMKFLNLIMW
uniref:NADH dehydrogenase subunit 4L n=1 Tax=Encyrtus infelix TaxID=355422 RepID=A0A411FRE2_9HYME|nr:NADH dehydrogenase subunit 4L [Encyrtus infelix]QBA96089.1 NADH dehydrogenase subunit 4L [Encyrtus infelix]QBA96102.1 NADH dehydrogenase subunit 4L [Encyrtus infelix]